MAVKIRLRRTGAKHQPSYRVVIADSRSPRDGRFIETIGHYNPRRHDDAGNPELYIDPERALYWLDRGAEASETTRSLLRRARILELRHDRDHGIDVAERLSGMSRKPAKVAVVEAPKREKATAAVLDTTPSAAATEPDEATEAQSTGSPAQPAEGGDPEQS